MFTVTVRDRTMVAHSLRGERFGPAQRLHGATYGVVVTISAEEVDDDGVVVDIGALARELRAVLSRLDYRNLDEDEAFASVNSTTEVLARVVADRLAERVQGGALAREATQLHELEVTLLESDVAGAGYRRRLGGGA